MKLMLIAGARPNFMKIASIVGAINTYNVHKSDLEQIQYRIVHTGQHYDDLMSRVFFDDLAIPKPDINLEVGSLSHATQTAEIMKRFEPVLLSEQPDVVILVGDVNSTVACALVTSKVVYPGKNRSHESRTEETNPPPKDSRPLIAHVEAGLRSFDRSMPEEINRMVTDTLSDFLFTTEESANQNLAREGVPEEKIFFVGNTMIDTLLNHREKANHSRILHDLHLLDPQPNSDKTRPIAYCVLTLHRPSNVDDRETFTNILQALSNISQKLPVIFPAHPRTLHRIREFGLEEYFATRGEAVASPVKQEGITCIDPLGYVDFLCLMANAKVILTDSGGMQEETTVLGVPCVTLRHNTERPVTVTNGTNVIVGTNKDDIVEGVFSQLERYADPRRIPPPPPFWDGQAGKRIVDVLAAAFGHNITP